MGDIPAEEKKKPNKHHQNPNATNHKPLQIKDIHLC